MTDRPMTQRATTDSPDPAARHPTAPNPADWQRERRIVVCYDIKDGRVVKGVSFVNLADQGDPADLVAGPAAVGADELVLLDIVGSPAGRPAFLKIVTATTAAAQVPVAVGGGIRALDDVRKALEAGAAKVGINSAIVANPELLSAAAAEFGSEKIVVALDAKRTPAATAYAGSAGFEVFVGGVLQPTGLDAVAWARECEQRGAGEILLTSIDRDGQRTGFDLDLTQAVASAVAIPVTASGGAGNVFDFVELFQRTAAAAGLAAGVIHDGTLSAAQIRTALKEAGVRTTGEIPT